MRRITTTAGFLLITMLTAFALAGCGRSDERAAQETVQNFMSATARHDAPGAKANLTSLAQANVNEANPAGSAKMTFGGGGDFSVGGAVVTDDQATVPVTTRDHNQETTLHFKLRREAGQWRIFALTTPIKPGGTEITLDFEHPERMVGEMLKALPQGFKEGAQAMGEGAKAFGEGFKAMGEAFKQGAENANRPKTP